MICFRLMDLKVNLILIWAIISYTSANTNNTNGKIEIQNFLNKYVGSIDMQTPSRPAKTIFKLRTSVDSEMAKFIKEKVKELKPFLQDENNADDDELTLDGEDETTIIQLSPQMRAIEDLKAIERAEKAQSFQRNIDKYKKLRITINKKLKKEKVSNKTRHLVTTTLDELIAKMITNQCWGNNNKQNKQRATTNSAVGTNWENLLKKVLSEYNKLTNLRSHQDGDFMDKFKQLMNVMSKDLSTLVGKHKVVCQITDPNDSKTNILRHDKIEPHDLKTVAEKELLGPDLEEKPPCDPFKVCSDELYEFMVKLYVKLNETTVNTVRDYASMFVLDVGNDSRQEKQRIVGLINNTASEIELRVAEVFKKQAEKFKLDAKKNKYSNMRYLYKYISKNIENVKKTMHESVAINLKSAREKLMKIIQKDLDVNINVELGNLEREIGGHVCPGFALCNGKYYGMTRRSLDGNNYVGNNRVFVELKVDVNLNNGPITLDILRANTKASSYKTTYKANFKVVWTQPPVNVSLTRTPRFKLVSRKDKRKWNSFKHGNQSTKKISSKPTKNTNTPLDNKAKELKRIDTALNSIVELKMAKSDKQTTKMNTIQQTQATKKYKTTKKQEMTTSHQKTSKQTPLNKKDLKNKEVNNSTLDSLKNKSLNDILKDFLNEKEMGNEIVKTYYKKREVKN